MQPKKDLKKKKLSLIAITGQQKNKHRTHKGLLWWYTTIKISRGEHLNCHFTRLAFPPRLLSIPSKYFGSFHSRNPIPNDS